MKRTLYLAATSIIFLFATQTLRAQDYNTAIGVKLGGYENGLSVKHFIKPNTALEGILGFRNKGVVITGLYQLHSTAFNVNSLKVYYGFGGHAGSIGDGVYRRVIGGNEVYRKGGILLGADGVLGLEYKLTDVPVAVSFDLNPRVELGVGQFFDLAPGLGIKYTF